MAETVLKTNTFCGCEKTMVYRHSLFGEQTVDGDTQLFMLQNWPMPELQEGFGFPAIWGTSSFLV
jgi:hypothetical protein